MNKRVATWVVAFALGLTCCAEEEEVEECSAEYVKGTCPSGKSCVNGFCLEDCSESALTGACPAGERCREGACVVLCAPENPDGECPDAWQCTDGVCTLTPIPIDVTGIVAPHPVSQALVSAGALSGSLSFGNMGDIIIQLAGGMDLVENGTNFTPLAQHVLDPSGCGAGGCPFSFTGIDLAPLSVALFAIVIDLRTPVPPYVPTQVAVLNAQGIAALKAAPTTVQTALFPISVESAVYMGTLGGLADPTTIIGRGFVFGLLLEADRTTPVAGATVVSQNPDLVIHYANDTFTAPGTATNAYGFFFAIADLDAASAPQQVLTGLGFTHGTLTIPAVSAMGTAPGVGFALNWLANP